VLSGYLLLNIPAATGIESFLIFIPAWYGYYDLRQIVGWLYKRQSEPAATNAPVDRSVHWMGCVFSVGARWGSSHSLYFSGTDHCTFFFFPLVWSRFFPGPDLISTAPTLVPYLLSPSDTATLITNYPIDLDIVLTTYSTNLATLLIT
jgi:hypothetical protein